MGRVFSVFGGLLLVPNYGSRRWDHPDAQRVANRVGPFLVCLGAVLLWFGF